MSTSRTKMSADTFLEVLLGQAAREQRDEQRSDNAERRRPSRRCKIGVDRADHGDDEENRRKQEP